MFALNGHLGLFPPIVHAAHFPCSPWKAHGKNTVEKVITLFRFGEETAQMPAIVCILSKRERNANLWVLWLVAADWFQDISPIFLPSLTAEREADSSLLSEVTSVTAEWGPGCGLRKKRLCQSLHVISKDVVKQPWKVFQYIFFWCPHSDVCVFRRSAAIFCCNFSRNITVLQYFALCYTDKHF